MDAKIHVKRMIRQAERDSRKQIYHSLSSMMIKAFNKGMRIALNRTQRKVK